MSWIVTLKLVECATTSNLLSGVRIYSPLLTTLGNSVYTDANGEAQIYDAYDMWEWVNLTISDAGYISKNFVINMSMDGTVQTVCLNREPPPDPNAPTTGGCFIVTATTGSPDSAELVTLRALRDRVSTASTLGSHLIEAIYAEYAQFSPAIANELASDDTARELVLDMVVRPLLAWYTLAGDLGLNPQNHNHDTAARNVTDACPPQYEELMLGLLQSVHTDAQSPDTPLNDLTPHAADYPLAAWALLDPLTRAWHAHRDHLDITEQIAQWLATAPLEQLDLTMSTETFQRELETLTGFLTFNPQQQQRMHNRLTTAHTATS